MLEHPDPAVGPPAEWRRDDGYAISTDPSRIDLDVVHGFLVTSYWAAGVPREVVRRSLAGSMAFAVYAPDGAQVGLARVISDRATFAYLADVFILEPHRGRGLSTWLMDVILAHPELQGLRSWVLATRDAHGLYERFGFERVEVPGRYMRKHDPDVYRRPSGVP